VREIAYEETQPLQIVRHVLNNREEFMKELFAESGRLFDK
jgi:hypothetical protein